MAPSPASAACLIKSRSPFLNNSVNVNQKIGDYSSSPLFLAILRGDKKLVTQLLQLGANVSTVDKFGNTALIKAVQLDKVEIVNLLLKQPSIDISAKNLKKFSAADYARSPEIRALINEHEARLSQESSSSRRP